MLATHSLPARLAVAASLLAALNGCARDTEPPPRSPADTPLAQILARGEIVFLTRNASTTYYEGRDGVPEGPDHDFAVAFAAHLDVNPRFVVKDSVAEVLLALEAGEGDVAAAAISRTPGRGQFVFGPAYQKVTHDVVCRRGGAAPSSAADLAGLRLLVASGTSYVEHLSDLAKWQAELRFETTDDLATEEIMELVWEREIDCTLADSNLVAIERRLLPELTVPFSLGSPIELGWAVRPDAGSLLHSIEEWFGEYRSSGEMDNVLFRYYGFIETFDYVDARSFRRALTRRLPGYRAWFEQAARDTGLDWHLLAAVAYQESRWNPDAVSPTGVKGLMMLTKATAGSLGVGDRSDPAQSIEGGARYLAYLRDRLDPDIAEPDRTWIALAAYNIGMGHVHDAQTLARELELDPHRWSDLRTVLPLLSKKRYYRNLQHGYARGGAPVAYVRRVRGFQDMLLRAERDAAEPDDPESVSEDKVASARAAPRLPASPMAGVCVAPPEEWRRVTTAA